MIKPNRLPPKSYLHECFKYDGSTGVLYWAKRPLPHFSRDMTWGSFNTRHAGKEAGYSKAGKHNSYIHLGLDGIDTRAHRIIYFMFNDGDQDMHIDHIDGDGINNRLENLRLVDVTENQRNARLRKLNKSGVSGVFWCKSSGQWRAAIRFGGKLVYLGLRKDWFEAVCLRKSADVKYNYHPNHGRAR